MLILSGLAAPSFGQSFVNFANSPSTRVSTNSSFFINGGPTRSGASGLVNSSLIEPSGYHYALLAQFYAGSGPTVNSTFTSLLSDNWIYTGALGNNNLAAGGIAGGANTQTTAGMPVGDANQFIVVGWSSNLGTTWNTFSTRLASDDWVTANDAFGFLGISPVGTGVGVDSGDIPELLFGGPSGIQTGFSLFLTPIPEPTTMALAGLAGLSLLLFRRRN